MVRLMVRHTCNSLRMAYSMCRHCRFGLLLEEVITVQVLEAAVLKTTCSDCVWHTQGIMT